jgi:hypothetical protein
VCTIYTSQILESNLGLEINGLKTGEPKRKIFSEALSLSQKDVHRLNLVSKLLSRINYVLSVHHRNIEPQTYQVLEVGEISHSPAIALEYFDHKCGSRPLQHRMRNIGMESKTTNSEETFFAFAMVVIPAAYGCAHLGALTIIFPTDLERLLWNFMFLSRGVFSCSTYIIYYLELLCISSWEVAARFSV